MAKNYFTSHFVHQWKYPSASAVIKISDYLTVTILARTSTFYFYKSTYKFFSYNWLIFTNNYIIYICKNNVSNSFHFLLSKTQNPLLTHPAMTMQPSWSTMSTSSGEGGEQKRCWNICKMDSTVFGVSFRETARWLSVRMVFVEIRFDSLAIKI